MELRHLRYFVTVAEELHFGRAALRLSISQPPLSQQIRQLEDEFGFPLFYRDKHHVELTEAGKVFLEEARLTLAKIEQALSAAEKAHQGARGRLVVGFLGSTTYNVVPLLLVYRKRFPLVDLTLHQMKTGHQLQALHDRSIHLGVVRNPVRTSQLVSETFQTEPFVAILSKSHPLALHENLRMQDLADEPFIVSSRYNGTSYHETVINLCYQAGFSPKIALEVPELLTIVAFVSEGMGIALVPSSFRHQQNNNIVYRELIDVTESLKTVFLWRKDEKSPILHEFLKVSEEFFMQLT
ncbi:LysR family transcriptional regulator [Paenibacillus frigoriresistens]|uniref:LysR family transcriptional regulator n=1 Tax=Paenibacillus alginolyticus TaxID=59839 RepID=UPI001566E173|nr:LysR family transcriptional regulator [Paenibacillus frigoriresistens]NRF94358.1 LysR family transcriptional regulator [Paenibacillus frigoriresistens]